MTNKTIVTLADSNYFPMLEELIDSINKHPESKNISICILDAGFTVEQVKIIEKKVYKIKKADWDIEVPLHKVAGKEWLKSQVSRAFLPNYFPEFEKYLWAIPVSRLNRPWELMSPGKEKLNRTVHGHYAKSLSVQ